MFSFYNSFFSILFYSKITFFSFCGIFRLFFRTHVRPCVQVATPLRGLLCQAIASASIAPRFGPRRGLLFFFFFPNLLNFHNSFCLSVFFYTLTNLLHFFCGITHAPHETRSLRYVMGSRLRVNSVYCFRSMFPSFTSGRACMTISRSTLALAHSPKNING